jgi:hypothetical protein
MKKQYIYYQVYFDFSDAGTNNPQPTPSSSDN